MARVYKVEIQVIADDDTTEADIYQDIEGKLNTLKAHEIYVQEVKYYGDIEESENSN